MMILNQVARAFTIKGCNNNKDSNNDCHRSIANNNRSSSSSSSSSTLLQEKDDHSKVKTKGRKITRSKTKQKNGYIEDDDILSATTSNSASSKSMCMKQQRSDIMMAVPHVQKLLMPFDDVDVILDTITPLPYLPIRRSTFIKDDLETICSFYDNKSDVESDSDFDSDSNSCKFRAN